MTLLAIMLVLAENRERDLWKCYQHFICDKIHRNIYTNNQIEVYCHQKIPEQSQVASQILYGQRGNRTVVAHALPILRHYRVEMKVACTLHLPHYSL